MRGATCSLELHVIFTPLMALHPCKVLLVPTELAVLAAQSRSGQFVEEANLLPLPGI